jgi:hypothetical protein
MKDARRFLGLPIALIAALVLVGVTALGATPTSANHQQGVARAGAVGFDSPSSTNGIRVLSLGAGERVTVIDCSGQMLVGCAWYRVLTSSGLTGWVASGALTVTPAN